MNESDSVEVGERFVRGANNDHGGQRRKGLVLFGVLLLVRACTFSMAFIALRHCPFINLTSVPGWMDYDQRWWVTDPNILWPLFASTTALLATLLFAVASAHRRIVLVLAICFPVGLVLVQWQVVGNYPNGLGEFFQRFRGGNGLELIRELSAGKLAIVLLLSMAPIVLITIAVRLVIRPWLARMKERGRQVTPWILGSIAVTLLLIRYAAIPYETAHLSAAITRSTEMRMTDGFVFGFYIGLLSLAVFAPVRFWMAVFFSFVVVVAGFSCELLFFYRPMAQGEPTIYTILFPIFFVPLALLFRLSSRQPRTASRDVMSGLAFAIAPALLLGLCVPIASSQFDLAVLAVTRDVDLARLACEASRCRVGVELTNNSLVYCDESRRDFFARMLPPLSRIPSTPFIATRFPGGHLSLAFLSKGPSGFLSTEPDFAPLMFDHPIGARFQHVHTNNILIENREQAELFRDLGRGRSLNAITLMIRGTAVDFESWKGAERTPSWSDLDVSGPASLWPAIQQGVLDNSGQDEIGIVCTAYDTTSKELWTTIETWNDQARFTVGFSESTLGIPRANASLDLDDPVWKNGRIKFEFSASIYMPKWLAQLTLSGNDRTSPLVELFLAPNLISRENYRWCENVTRVSAVPSTTLIPREHYNLYREIWAEDRREGEIISLESDSFDNTNAWAIEYHGSNAKYGWHWWSDARTLPTRVESHLVEPFQRDAIPIKYRTTIGMPNRLPNELQQLQELYFGLQICLDYEFVQFQTGLKTLQIDASVGLDSALESIRKLPELETLIVIAPDPNLFLTRLAETFPPGLKRLHLVSDQISIEEIPAAAAGLDTKIEITVRPFSDFHQLLPECLREYRRAQRAILLKQNAELGGE